MIENITERMIDYYIERDGLDFSGHDRAFQVITNAMDIMEMETFGEKRFSSQQIRVNSYKSRMPLIMIFGALCFFIIELYAEMVEGVVTAFSQLSFICFVCAIIMLIRRKKAQLKKLYDIDLAELKVCLENICTQHGLDYRETGVSFTGTEKHRGSAWIGTGSGAMIGAGVALSAFSAIGAAAQNYTDKVKRENISTLVSFSQIVDWFNENRDEAVGRIINAEKVVLN